ncbi:serine/threonine-protein kinase [Carboxylicivirga sp. N1Y90]|uniref:serine/threonine-protein kinase n=1 Tax=Carboxylicivirga fragile TaxID=3417571 RepID=UPI003D3283AF|nr:serine/threonine protein kinase [Marinilabiliaceae bacterium N1Y90]
MTELKGIHHTYKLDLSEKNKRDFIAYRAHDEHKVLLYKCSDTFSKPSAYNTLLSIVHPNINNPIDIIRIGGVTYMVSELLEGTSLKTILETRKLYHKLPESFFISLAIKILEALAELHKHKVLHLDIKPSNILIRDTIDLHPSKWNADKVLITKLEKAAHYPISNNHNRFSLAYSPPEQLTNKMQLVSPSSDLYALAIMLYEMIAGSPPFVDCEVDMLLQLQLSYPIKKRPSMRQEFFDIINKATQKPASVKVRDNTYDQVLGKDLIDNINHRYQLAEEMIADLEQYKHLIKEKRNISLWNRFLRLIGQ